MSQRPDVIGQTGMGYFGRTTASISHELKNALAIIRENAGLMNDYLAMAATGRPIDPEKFKQLAGRIEAQTQRADTLIKNMNRFAHTVDDPVRSIDLNETAELLAALSHREAAMCQVELEVLPSTTPLIVSSAPYLLLTLFGHCLTFALKSVPQGNRLTLRVLERDKKRGIRFEQITNLAEQPQASFPDARVTALLDATSTQCNIDGSAGSIWITVENMENPT